MSYELLKFPPFYKYHLGWGAQMDFCKGNNILQDTMCGNFEVYIN